MATNSGTGLKKETAAALSYLLGALTGVIFLVLEKDPYVRFHAMQSIVFSISVIILQAVLGFTIILAFLVPIVSVVALILWVLLMYKAAQGEEWQLPVVGKLARQLV